MKKILVMGLPGAGKTTFAEALYKRLKQANLKVTWFNADKTREFFDDWDFSPEGRLRQAYRMSELARLSDSDYVICDFVAPTELLRIRFDADIVVWLDTISQGRFEDTNKLFEPPTHPHFKITEQNAEKYVEEFIKEFNFENAI